MITGSVSATETEAATVLVVRGDLDLHGAPALRPRLRWAVSGAERPVVVVDLTEVSVLDDVGAGVLLGLRRLAAGDGRAMSVRAGDRVSDVLRELGIADLLTVR